ncbi:MAG: 50S ribosomal protein L17 [Bacilli bacterium]|jgi:large subunit ribosomal protein L17|nr:50S ribosomal protein L17 [Bacilli bacterium]MCH4210904.1 50S ribosomal protein L17 [Bacilli bacterium]MCH4228117.1 50S ribosomal protein L17 [Bacilli bacterium]MCH4278381.1 50S ribosomal protein L17 [Bacilli bacterium]MCI2054577.1 50S ribosomal protein L17 [Bacilli bacterium]
MASQGRKNVHGKTGVRFKAPYTASKNKAMLRNVVSSLIVNGSVKVTAGVTPELITLSARLVGYAKDGSLAARRNAASIVRKGIVDANGVEALDKLFKEIGPKFKDRNGGYTQVYKLGARKGDNAEVELVKWVD